MTLDDAWFERQRAEMEALRKAAGRPKKTYYKIVYDKYGRVREYQRTPSDPVMVREHGSEGVVDRPKAEEVPKKPRARGRKNITPEELKKQVLKDWNTGQYKQNELAAKYGVSQSTISSWVRS
jgi:hypothetical protein